MSHYIIVLCYTENDLVWNQKEFNSVFYSFAIEIYKLLFSVVQIRK